MCLGGDRVVVWTERGLAGGVAGGVASVSAGVASVSAAAAAAVTIWLLCPVCQSGNKIRLPAQTR
ncbi:hypothetical protein DL89DRAFT_271864 [Linderina pennispora]|uniref:Uncharacterized protein n=1 Tax=Linderina pennispora TaxID=61395 RepID=A0A1Y1VU41_9FUNG|nr:uncharacterized protein DL89DRAFT_271864 [Linderina pennispora]ORX64797.1 hypothetical protein DL89DRAFT_271864 [Linderina pennispora]